MSDYQGHDYEPEPEFVLPSNAFKLMTFNVRYKHNEELSTNNWEFRRYAVYSMLEDQKPIVMGTQECLMSQRNDILSNVPAYKAFGGGRNNGKEDSDKDGESMSIFYLPDSLSLISYGTFWLNESGTVGAKGWDAACIRCCTWGLFRHKRLNKDFYYFNTHLDHKGTVARTEEMKLLQSKMAEINTGGLPCALSADFNTGEEDKIFNDLYKVMNSARKTSESKDFSGTYNGFGGSSSSIDHIFYNGFGKVLKFKVVTDTYAKVSYISDHYPVYAVFTFN